MEVKIRDGKMDVAVLAGPRLKTWPTQGVRVLSRHCSDAGLKVGWYGGTGMKVRGVLPLEGSGAVVMVEDAQKRLHRIQAKTVVKVIPELNLPLPFPGWYSPGLIPESTARKLLVQGRMSWHPVVVVLGTGNRALRLGTELIQKHVANRVVCLESVYDRVQGWEVEKRRFEVAGGKIIYGKLSQFTQKTPFLWELKVQDENGTRVMDVARVISVGPFETDLGFREYPAGSFLIEWENTDAALVQDDVENVLLDESRAVILAARLIKGVSASERGYDKNLLEKSIWFAKQKLKELEAIDQWKFDWNYQGKWLSKTSKEVLDAFPGTPKQLRKGKTIASIECVEEIGCRVCEKGCPANAIKIERDLQGGTRQFLVEDACTGCGVCLQVCPSQVPILFEGDHTESFSTLILPYRELPLLKKGERVALLNRRGEVLASSKVLDQFVDGEVPLFKIEVPSHLAWEVRGILSLTPRAEVENVKDLYEEGGVRVEIQIQGDVRRVRENQNVSVALFEIGMSRPNDNLICEDGSCGLCAIEVDGIRKLACESTIHKGMAMRFVRDHEQSSSLCPCENISVETFEEKCRLAKPESVEALSQITDAGRGRCHGLLCQRSCMQLAEREGVKTQRYAEWMFPWTDWAFK